MAKKSAAKIAWINVIVTLDDRCVDPPNLIIIDYNRQCVLALNAVGSGEVFVVNHRLGDRHWYRRSIKWGLMA